MVWRDYNELVLYTIDGEYQVNNGKRKGAITISGNKLLGYLQSEKKLDMLFKQNNGFKAFISVNDTYNTMTMTLIMNGTFNPGDFGEKIDDLWTNEVIAVLKTDFSRMTYTDGRKISKATWKKYVTEHKDDTDIDCRDFLLTLAALIGYDDSGYNKMCSLLYADLG